MGKEKKLKSSKKRPTFSKCSFSFIVILLQQPLLKLTYLLNPSNVKLQANYLTEFTWKNEYYDDVISSLWWRKQYLLANLLVTLISYLPLYLLQVPMMSLIWVTTRGPLLIWDYLRLYLGPNEVYQLLVPRESKHRNPSMPKAQGAKSSRTKFSH